MSTEHSQALPRSVVLLRLLRRILSVTAVACAAAGMIASADALISGFGDGGDKLSVATDNSTVITGSISSEQGNRGLQVRIEPPEDGLTASDIRVSNSFFPSRMNWSALLYAAPSALGKNFTVTAGSPDTPPHELDVLFVQVLPNAAAVRANSSSFLMRIWGWEPLNAAFAALIVAATACLLYFGLIYFGSAWLAKRGFVRVYHTRQEGDDTMLYFIDPQSSLNEAQTYPVLSAAGKLMGTAEVTSRGARYCILKLTAAQARTGCLVALPIEAEAADI